MQFVEFLASGAAAQGEAADAAPACQETVEVQMQDAAAHHEEEDSEQPAPMERGEEEQQQPAAEQQSADAVGPSAADEEAGCAAATDQVRQAVAGVVLPPLLHSA